MPDQLGIKDATPDHFPEDQMMHTSQRGILLLMTTNHTNDQGSHILQGKDLQEHLPTNPGITLLTTPHPHQKDREGFPLLNPSAP